MPYGPEDQIAVITTSCPAYGWAADSYTTLVDWGVGGGNQTTKNGAPVSKVFYNGADRYVVFNGTYPVYANNVTFNRSFIGKSVSPKVTLELHCLDWFNTIAYPFPGSVTIWDRVPVEQVTAPASVGPASPYCEKLLLILCGTALLF